MKHLDKCQRDCRALNPLAGRTIVLRCYCGHDFSHVRIGWDGTMTWNAFWAAYRRFRLSVGCNCSLVDVWRGYDLVFNGWGNPVRILPAHPLSEIPPEEIDTGEVL